MRSNKDWLMDFGHGLMISAYQNEKSAAWAWNSYWVHPKYIGDRKVISKDTENPTKKDVYLFFAGG